MLHIILLVLYKGHCFGKFASAAAVAGLMPFPIPFLPPRSLAVIFLLARGQYPARQVFPEEAFNSYFGLKGYSSRTLLNKYGTAFLDSIPTRRLDGILPDQQPEAAGQEMPLQAECLQRS